VQGKRHFGRLGDTAIPLSTSTPVDHKGAFAREQHHRPARRLG